MLTRTNLAETDLRFAILSNSELNETDLSGADLRRAILSGADLNKADLSDALGITNEELAQQSSSLKGATMPTGQKYEDWLKDKEGRK